MQTWIFHIDADSFFATVIQACNPQLRGKPVVAGAERGVVTAMSREAKAIGVPRGLPGFKIKRDYPQVVLAHADFVTYSLYSKRIRRIIAKHVENVEVASVDEVYATCRNSDPEGVAAAIQKEVQIKTGCTVSVGIAQTKTLAKLVSSINKPNGVFTITPQNSKAVFAGPEYRQSSWHWLAY